MISSWLIKILGVLTLLSSVVIYYFSEQNLPGGTDDVFRLELAFSLENFSALLKAWGEEGVQYYRALLYWDMFYLVIYGSFLMSCLYYYTQKINLLVLLPVLSSTFDVAENIFHFIIFSDLQTINAKNIFAASVCASFKLFFLLTSMLFIVYYFLRRRIQKK